MLNTLLILLTFIEHSIGDQYDHGLACRYCEYCLVSYCIGMGGHGVPSWKCPACKKYFPDVNNVTVLKTGFLDYDIHAFVAYEPNMPEIIIGFEGTEILSIVNLINDFDDEKINYPLSDCGSTPPCQVHKGTFNSYNAIRLELWKTVMQYLDYFGHNTSIHITGHSLGSTLATNCALDGALNYNRTYDYIYTFGTPRVGDLNFAEFYVKHIPYHYRVTHHKDPAPEQPQAKKGFHHISHEVYYETDPNGTYKVCDGSGEDKSCRDKYGYDAIWIADHLDYMGFDFVTNEIECKI